MRLSEADDLFIPTLCVISIICVLCVGLCNYDNFQVKCIAIDALTSAFVVDGNKDRHRPVTILGEVFFFHMYPSFNIATCKR